MSETLARERRFIFISILFLSLLGLLMVYEASSIYAFKNFSDSAYFFKRQVVFLVVGIIFFFLALLPDLDVVRRFNKEMLIITLLLLIAVLFIGKRVGGAKRWLYFFGVTFQPSELLKISFLLYAADYFERKGQFIRDFKIGLLPLGTVVAAIFILLILEPDMGAAMFWLIWTFIFLFIVKARKKHLLAITGLGVMMAFALVTFFPYRFRRIIAYLNPFADPQGAGFQLIQSQIAYGEGGVLGVGFAAGKQKLAFLPAAHTDFIFSIIAEEFGLIGGFALIVLFAILFHKMFKIARSAGDPFRRNVLLGVVVIIFLEIVINIGVSCGFFPTKGLPLPFMSYGGSNLVTSYLLLGIFFNASRKEKSLTLKPIAKRRSKK